MPDRVSQPSVEASMMRFENDQFSFLRFFAFTKESHWNHISSTHHKGIILESNPFYKLQRNQILDTFENLRNIERLEQPSLDQLSSEFQIIAANQSYHQITDRKLDTPIIATDTVQQNKNEPDVSTGGAHFPGSSVHLAQLRQCV